MDIKEYISSGIIELYAMNALSLPEIKEVERMASLHPEVAEEISRVQESLNDYVTAYSRNPRASLRKEIIGAVTGDHEFSSIPFPHRISENSNVDEWLAYLEKNSITPPEEYDMVHLLYLPGNEKQATYVAWAKKGAVVEESHSDEDEYLLMLKGRCSVTIDGSMKYYNEGDIAFIPKGAVHRAEVLSDEPMLILGQRIAS